MSTVAISLASLSAMAEQTRQSTYDDMPMACAVFYRALAKACKDTADEAIPDRYMAKFKTLYEQCVANVLAAAGTSEQAYKATQNFAILLRRITLLRRIALTGTLFAASAVGLAYELYTTPFHGALLKAPIGSIRKVGTWTAQDFEAVCILHPYQDRLNKNGDVAASVNAHLAKVGYSSDEGHFAFVFVRKQSIEIEKIKRSQELDFFGNRKLPTAISDAVPHTFSQEDCVLGPSAAIIKIRFDDRTYLLFGQAP